MGHLVYQISRLETTPGPCCAILGLHTADPVVVMADDGQAQPRPWASNTEDGTAFLERSSLSPEKKRVFV